MKTILLAEDDPAHVALFRRALEKVGIACRLDVATDGAEAIDYLFATGVHAGRDPKQMPDLILLDLKMPKMNGFQVLQILRRVRHDDGTRFPPVVILTSSREEADIVEGYRLGAYSFIPKPADFSELIDAVRQIVQYWIGLNESPSARQLLPPNFAAGARNPFAPVDPRA